MKQNMMRSAAVLQNSPVAEFTIDGKNYFVFPAGREAGAKPSRRDVRDLSGYLLDGDLRIGDNRYFIASSVRQDAGPLAPKNMLHSLSKREWDIVMHVAEGRANKQIADALHISEWTVSTHLRRIFAKLGVDSRAAMVFKCSHLVRK